jgi:hypothetical protein
LEVPTVSDVRRWSGLNAADAARGVLEIGIGEGSAMVEFQKCAERLGDASYAAVHVR